MKRISAGLAVLVLLYAGMVAAGEPARTAPSFTDMFVSAQRDDSWQGTQYTLLDAEDLAAFSAMIGDEMARYPEGFFARIGLDTIVLCRDLTFKGTRRAAVPDNRSTTLYLSYDSSYTRDYMIHVFHHELNHYTEYHLWREYRHTLPTWPRAPGSDAGKGGEFAYGAGGDWYSLETGSPGYLNRYATLGEEEDRSEIIAFFMASTGDERAKVLERIRADGIIAAKCALLFDLYARELGWTALPARLAAGAR
jgi:hypothetical protein